MKTNKYKISCKTIFVALLMVLFCCAILGYSLFCGSKSANALTGGAPESSTVTNPIYDFDKYCYDKDALDMLARQVMNDSTANIDRLISYAELTAKEEGKPITNKNITVQYGRYRFTDKNDYRSLYWLPVYVSTAKDTGDAILTLYLAATSTLPATSQQEAGYYSNMGSYSANASATPPSYGYGSSFIRAASLGNGGKYAYYAGVGASSGNTDNEAKILKNNNNKFSDFIKGSDFTGVLNEDIVSPSQVKWQATESAVKSLTGTQYGVYNWFNDAYGVPSTGNFYLPEYFPIASNEFYSVWQNDKVWLPSITEVGSGDTGSLNGIWQLNKNQRSNDQIAWLRSAANNVKKTSNYSAYTMYCTAEDGSITTYDINGYDNTAGASNSPLKPQLAIRPAIHLNLSKITEKYNPPVNLPDTVSTVYNGEPQVISSEKCTIDKDLIPWFVDDGSMIVSFYAGDDETQTNSAIAPINAGTYYMLVKLYGDKTFLGEDPSVSVKVTKFIIEKAKIGVEWQYDSDSIPSIKNVVGTIYEVDRINNTVPTVSLRYRAEAGTGDWYYEYPDKKGYYIAYAYIVDEEIHNYNYEVAVVNGVKTSSNKFNVKQKGLDKPYFLELGENVGTTLERSYKGKQYIEIANISKYLEIEVTSKKEGAAETVEAIGITPDGIMVYRVETVAEYTFKVKIKDKVNTMWSTGTVSSPDLNEVSLKLTIRQAAISVTFEGLPSSWEQSRQMTFDLAISGLQAEQGVEMTVYYLSPNQQMVTVTKDANDRYTIRSGLALGTYTLAASIAKDGQYNGNYTMNVATKTQRFDIVQTVSTFNKDYVRWEYLLGGKNTSLAEILNGNTQSTPLNFNYVDDFYQVKLTLDETRLKSYYVKAVYSGYVYSETDKDYVPFEGAKYVKDAGSYCVKVTITAYDKNVIFTEQEYSVYFNIQKVKFNLSNVKWDYDTAYQYTGEEQKVLLKADTLPEGLTPSYIANTATQVGNYTSSVRFLLADEYAANYEVPNVSDVNSYTGTFSFNLSWEIVPQEIEIVWETDNSSSDLLFVPTLRFGGSLVDYSFEHLVSGSWTPCDSVQPAATVAEKYRVTAKIKNAYSNNYVLTGSTAPCEFQVQSGKLPVAIHYELNNVRCENGDEFVYTGSAYNATAACDTAGTQITSTVTYYTANDGGNKLNQLSEAPTTVGNYVAVFSVSLTNAYVTNEGETEVYFKIVKADIDISSLEWQCSHGSSSTFAKFDADLQKWVDNAGKEVLFSFEYDGTPYSFALVGYAEGVTLGNVSGGSGTNAGDYTTTASFTWDENYNEPAFPATLHWTIIKAPIHFDGVKWGYIDAEGNEHEFDFENDTFVFTRDANSVDNGPVKFTVGLINLPEGIKNLITYKSICLTEINSKEAVGSTFSAVGTYRTTLTIAGTFTDPNYETFKAADLPVSIPRFLEWDIAKRELTKISYDKSWELFDGNTHDFIELCGIPREELYYYQVEITFLDESNAVYNSYEGYEGVAYTGFHAGTYTVRFYELVGDAAELIFWDSREFEVQKYGLKVSWDDKGAIPVARVTGTYVSDMIGTRYTNLDGGEVSLAYIRASQGAQVFVARPYVLEAYATNIAFEMADGQDPEKEFRYSPFVINSESVAIDKSRIGFDLDEMEYTGENLTFRLSVLDSYSDYLYYDGDSLTQKEVGTYHVTVSFIKYDSNKSNKREGNAYWAGTDGERDSIVLEFRIIPRTSLPLEYPTLDKTRAEYTGAQIAFIINNWIAYKDYMSYNVTFRGHDLGTQLTHKEAGIYTVTFRFLDGSIGYWSNDPSNPKGEYEIKFEIYDPNNQTTTLIDPKLQLGTAVTNKASYTGSAITFSIANWDSYYSKYVDIVGDLSATNVGTYNITLVVKAGISAVFENGEDTYTLSYTIQAGAPSDEVPLDKPRFVENTKTYTGSDLLFEIANWADLYSTYLNITGDSLTQSKTGGYSVTLSFKANSKAYWRDTNGYEDITLKFYIRDTAASNEPARINPDDVYLVVDAKEYTGREIQFEINSWESYFKNYLEIDGGAGTLSLLQTEVGVYTISVKPIDGKATWEGGTVIPISLTFRIKKATLTVTGVDENGKVTATNGDGESVDIDKFLDYVYRDEFGNIVLPEEMEDGKSYFVTAQLKPDMYDEFDDCFENGIDAFDQQLDSEINSANDGKGISFVKSENKGLSTILIITIAVVAVLILLVIATVIVLIVKKHQFDSEEEIEYIDDEVDD